MPPPTIPPPHETMTPPASRGLLLVVEDDSFLRKLLSDKLRREHFEVVEAVNGQEAIDFLHQQRTPALMLLDLMMPGVDGFQVLEKIRAEAETKDLPVIVLSNVGEKHIVDRVQALGADDYLVKAHFILDEIIERITKVLAKRYI